MVERSTMITIHVFGTTPPCVKCKRAESEANKAAESFPGQVEVVKFDALGPEADHYGLMATPTVVIDGEIVGLGKVVSAQEIIRYIHSKLGA
jgi:thiol-disulfide isomerase/thioredoxin